MAADEAAVLSAYQAYWALKVALFADPAQDLTPDAERVAVDTAYADLVQTHEILRENGIAFVGAPILDPTVSDVQAGDGGTATVIDCVDSTNWQPIYTESGESAAAPGQAPRLVTTSTAYFYDERWTIRTSVVDRETTC